MKNLIVTALSIFAAAWISGCSNDSGTTTTEAGQKNMLNTPSGSSQAATTARPSGETADGSAAVAFDPRVRMAQDPASTCTYCHDSDEVARYRQIFLPIYKTMFAPAYRSGPAFYWTGVPPIVHPAMYAQWYSRWVPIAEIPAYPDAGAKR